MTQFIGGGYSNPGIPGLGEIVQAVKGRAEDRKDARNRDRELTKQHQFQITQMAYGHQLGMERDLFQHNLGTMADNSRMLHEQRMSYTNANLADDAAARQHSRNLQTQASQQGHEMTMATLHDSLQSNRERAARNAQTRATNREHANAKDMVTHVASTLAQHGAGAPFTGLSVPGGSAQYGTPPENAPAATPGLPAWATTPLGGGPARKGTKRSKSPKPKPPGADLSVQFSSPGGVLGAPPTPRRPL